MTDDELTAIEARYRDHAESWSEEVVPTFNCAQDVPALAAEVRRLRAALDTAYSLGSEDGYHSALPEVGRENRAKLELLR